MKPTMALAALLALAALPVHAQTGGGSRWHHGAHSNKSEQKKPKIDERAYQAALKKIPDPKEKYEPWGFARPAEEKAK